MPTRINWLPISTAPKDGTVIIVSGTYRNGLPMIAAPAKWSDYGGIYNGEGGAPCMGMWWRDDGYGFTIECHPTHWIPLPK